MAGSLLQGLLAKEGPLLLDGAVGTELARRGVDTGLPLWSARALADATDLKSLESIHADYARAGAELLVTNTFRTTLRTLEAAGWAGDWRLLNQRAVDAARAGAGGASGPCLVAGGIAPLEDCYRTDLVPSAERCLAEHRRQIDLLNDLGVDLILIETMNCRREALAALKAAAESGLDTLLSLCPAPPCHMLSGEPLDEVIPELLAAGGATLRGLLLNCASLETLAEVYPRFASLAASLPHGVYAHLGEPDPITGWKLPDRHEPGRYASWVAGRLDEGARIVGGCCGTTPEHIAAISRMIAGR